MKYLAIFLRPPWMCLRDRRSRISFQIETYLTLGRTSLETFVSLFDALFEQTSFSLSEKKAEIESFFRVVEIIL